MTTASVPFRTTVNFSSAKQVIILLRFGRYYPSMAEHLKSGSNHLNRSIHFGTEECGCTPIWVGSPAKLEDAVNAYISSMSGRYMKHQILEALSNEGGGNWHWASLTVHRVDEDGHAFLGFEELIPIASIPHS